MILWPKHHDLFAPQKVAEVAGNSPETISGKSSLGEIWFREGPDWYIDSGSVDNDEHWRRALVDIFSHLFKDVHIAFNT